MKIRPLFNRYQHFLLKFVNTQFGRSYIGAKENLPIWKVTPDSFHYIIDNKSIGVFKCNSPYLKKFHRALEGLKIIEDNYGIVKNFFKKPEWVIPHFQDLTFAGWLPLLARTETTFYPDAHPETTSCDGYVQNNDNSWSTCRSAGTGDSAADTGITNVFRCDIVGGSEYRLARLFTLFDTSSMGGGATVDSATWKITISNAAAAREGGLVSTNPASNTGLTTADFNQLGSTEGSDSRFTCASTGQKTLTLNATGEGWIAPSGVTKLGARRGLDLDNTTPTADDGGNPKVHAAESASDDPELVVTYTPGPAGNVMFFGGGVTVG